MKKSKESFNKTGVEIKNFNEKEISKKEYLEKKFSFLKYDEKYIMKCLQRDILDFQEFTKEQIKKVKSTQEELIKLIQDAVQEVMPDYEVKLYGSHATNLCLQWSDLDVVLIHKRNYNASNYTALQSLYINLLVNSILKIRKNLGKSRLS
jgi:DNA polymerase sigma